MKKNNDLCKNNYPKVCIYREKAVSLQCKNKTEHINPIKHTIMKTQINTLQRGHGNKGIIGTSFEIRREVAQAVKAENPSAMRVFVNGIEMELTYTESTTGKSFWYESKALPVDIVKLIVPGDTKAINHPELVSYHFRINGDMTCEYVSSRRRSEQASWKPGQLIEVAEANVTII